MQFSDRALELPVTIGVVYRCPNITKQNNEILHNAITEVSKGDCVITGDNSTILEYK